MGMLGGTTQGGMPPTDPNASADSSAMGAECPEGCQEVPLSSLAQPDDKEQMTTPGKGDNGTMQVDYEVVGINGETAYVKPLAINGHSLDEDDDQEPDPESPDSLDSADMAQEGDDLRSAAGNMGATPQ